MREKKAVQPCDLSIEEFGIDTKWLDPEMSIAEFLEWKDKDQQKVRQFCEQIIECLKNAEAENAQLKADNERIVKQLKDMDDLIGEFNKNEIVLMRKIEALRKQAGE